jgi:hypothetical protein
VRVPLIINLPVLIINSDMTLTHRCCLRALSVAIVLLLLSIGIFAQSAAAAKQQLGSATAKNGFKNETDIQNKFNAWRTDADARGWLTAMGYSRADITSVTATKPSGEKADVEVTVKTKRGERTEGISIKLVSGTNGFNQVDKRWLAHYAKMWSMPAAVESALMLFVGETPPTKPGRAAGRMYLDEIDDASQKAVIDFFSQHKAEIVSDLLQGDGPHAAGWLMVAFKATANTRWTLKRIADVIKFYSDGPVAITRGGNLKIGRITMQRKGGDGGRDTAKMLQFKVDPTLLMGN